MENENLKDEQAKDNIVKCNVNGSVFCVGDKVIVFDGSAWSKTGDIGDNSQFYKKAKIVRVYWHIPKLYGSTDWCADVKWEHNGEISNGHFVRGLKHYH